jgi:signal peptidase I
MSINNKEDDVIVFDPFDDEGYEKWLKARQEAQKKAELQKQETADEYHVEKLEPVVLLPHLAQKPPEKKTEEAPKPAPSTEKTAPVKPAADKPAKKEEPEEPKELTPEQKKRRMILNIVEIAAYLIMAFLIIKFVPKYVMERVSVEGESMMETLHDGDQLIGEKLSVRFNNLKRYDIIYFAPKGNHKSVDFIKRIIGLPGETIYIVDSVVYVNGRPLQEDFAREADFLAYTAASPITLAEDEFFVMGDNRNHSTDSRSSSVGVVHLKDIEGRAVFRLWPLSDFGKID